MKLQTQTLIAVTAFLCVSVGANYVFATSQYERNVRLEQCASENNVYQCRWSAVPVTAPRVVIQQAELLPPLDDKYRM